MPVTSRDATRLGVGLLAATALLAAAPGVAQACTCASTGSAREDARAVLKDADAAFTGRLISVKEIDDGIPPGQPAPPPDAIFRYRVLRDFNGPLGKFVKVRSSTEGAACGLPVRKGRKYALGIYGRPKRWSSGLCSLVRPRALRKVATAGSGRAIPQAGRPGPRSRCAST
jgi:hypothetical protein